jgi:hypothetical protein
VSERDSVSALARLLEGLGIRCVLFGALAANRYRAETRTTADVDLLLLDAGPGHDALTRALEETRWTVSWMAPERAILRARHPELGLADLIIAGTDFERTAIARARRDEGPGAFPIDYLAPEDVILFKLIAGRPQDLADVEAIVAAGTAVDETYLEAWAEAWDVLDAWRRMRGEASDAGTEGRG